MRSRISLWMASATITMLIVLLGAGSTWVKPAAAKAPARKTAHRSPNMSLGAGTFVGHVIRIADKKGRILKAELKTDKGMVLLLRLNGKGLDLAKKAAKGKKVEVGGTAKQFASKKGRGIELVVDQWKTL